MLTLSVIVPSDVGRRLARAGGQHSSAALPWLVIVWLLLVFPSGSYAGQG